MESVTIIPTIGDSTMTTQRNYHVQQMVLVVLTFILAVLIFCYQVLVGDRIRYELLLVTSFMIAYLAIKIARHRSGKFPKS